MSADGLTVGGLTPLTTVDFPGQLAAVVFCQGCPWRCPYCHNPHLLSRRTENPVPWQEVRQFLDRRRGFLDAVVFSGGEPLMQAAIEDAVAEVRGLGFGVGLHTGGCDPARFARLLPSLDWVGFDAKAPFGTYPRVTGVADSGRAAHRSLERLLAAGIPYEVRTTVDPSLLGHSDLLRLAAELATLGVTRWVLQEHRDPMPGNSPAPTGRENPWNDGELLAVLGESFEHFDIRSG